MENENKRKRHRETVYTVEKNESTDYSAPEQFPGSHMKTKYWVMDAAREETVG